MKSLRQMDLEEWELLPDDGFLEINYDRGKKIYSRKFIKGSGSVFQTNYFICPPKSSPEFVDRTRPDQLLPVPIDLEPTTLRPHEDRGDHREQVKEEALKIPVEIKIMPPVTSKKIESFNEQDPVSQVFFKKMKETEFFDMKVESPKSGASMGIVPQIEAFQFEKEEDPCKEGKVDGSEMDLKESDADESGLNIWKWSLTGIGAICSFGVAVCIIVLSGDWKNKRPQQNQKLQFQIYTGDKQVVERPSKINEAISAVRGVPLTRARITFGGYYDASV